MLRKTAMALGFLLMVTAAARSAEVKGTFKSADTEKNIIVLTIEGVEKSLDAAASVKVVTVSGKAKKPQFEPVAGGLKGLTAGAEVTCLTATEDGKELVKEVRIQGAKKKKKNK